MPGASDVAYGNEKLDAIYYLPSVTFPTLGASASASNTATLNGALPGDFISWSMQAPPAHIFLENIYVSSANTISLLWTTDASGISTGTVAVVFEVVRATNANLGLSALPSAIV
jgi:hypothetical protein